MRCLLHMMIEFLKYFMHLQWRKKPSRRKQSSVGRSAEKLNKNKEKKNAKQTKVVQICLSRLRNLNNQIENEKKKHGQTQVRYTQHIQKAHLPLFSFFLRSRVICVCVCSMNVKDVTSLVNNKKTTIFAFYSAWACWKIWIIEYNLNMCSMLLVSCYYKLINHTLAHFIAGVCVCACTSHWEMQMT